jgi:hypothetical protein
MSEQCFSRMKYYALTYYSPVISEKDRVGRDRKALIIGTTSIYLLIFLSASSSVCRRFRHLISFKRYIHGRNKEKSHFVRLLRLLG